MQISWTENGAENSIPFQLLHILYNPKRGKEKITKPFAIRTQFKYNAIYTAHPSPPPLWAKCRLFYWWAAVHGGGRGNRHSSCERIVCPRLSRGLPKMARPSKIVTIMMTSFSSSSSIFYSCCCCFIWHMEIEQSKANILVLYSICFRIWLDYANLYEIYCVYPVKLRSVQCVYMIHNTR